MLRADNNEPYWIAKQRTFGDNLIACYTSNNVDVTTAALDRIERGADVKSLGRSLFRFHRQYGGFTELLTVVWPRDADKPQILEVMPPLYDPRPRSGIVGIGQRQVLDRFTKELNETPSSLVWPIPTEAEEIEQIDLAFGGRDTWLRFRLIDAIGRVSGALISAIEQVNAPDVALPLEVKALQRTGVTFFEGKELDPKTKEGKWLPVTAKDSELTLPPGTPIPGGEKPVGLRNSRPIA